MVANILLVKLSRSCVSSAIQPRNRADFVLPPSSAGDAIRCPFTDARSCGRCCLLATSVGVTRATCTGADQKVRVLPALCERQEKLRQCVRFERDT